MILEQRLREVSNRSSGNADDLRFEEAVRIQVKTQIKIVDDKPKIIKSDSKLNKKPEPENEKVIEKNLATEVIDEADLREQYGLFENQDVASVNYGTLFSYLEHKLNPEETYAALENMEATKSVIFESNEEVEETILKVNLAYALGDKNSVSYEEKEKIRNLARDDYSLFNLHRSLSLIKSDNVDYDRLN